jgi:hypothetical protein
VVGELIVRRYYKMGNTKGPYNEEYPVGTKVRIQSRANLEKFIIEWNYHDPLSQEQLAYAEKIAVVESVGFYHGGDELYKLKDINGLWHEVNLLLFVDGNT